MEALWSEPVARGLRAERMSRDTPPWLSAEQVEALDALGRSLEMTGAPALVAENEEHLDVLTEECVDRYQSDEGMEIRRELTRGWTVLAPLMEDEAQLPDYSSLPKQVAESLRGADKGWRYVHQKREAWQAMMTLASNAEFEADRIDSLANPRRWGETEPMTRRRSRGPTSVSRWAPAPTSP